jgi:hypothetical protein
LFDHREDKVIEVSTKFKRQAKLNLPDLSIHFKETGTARENVHSQSARIGMD